MSFEMVSGQARAKRILQNELRTGKVSHAYIFSGPVGTGRKAMAFAFAQALFCERQESDACGVCIECRKVEHRNHPDLFLLEPDGSSIKIDQIRELQKEFAYRSRQSQTKIYIVEQAEKMTVQAANSLLKFLEEPGASIVAILITENAGSLLQTIRSRAQLIEFLPLSPERMLEQLVADGCQPELARCAVHLTAGIEAAKQLIQLNWFAEMRNVVIQLGKESVAHFPRAVVTVQQKVAKTDLIDHIDTLLDLFILWLKDLVHAQFRRNHQMVFTDQLDWMTKHAFSQEPSFWIRRMDRALELRKRLRLHVNPQLILEQFLGDVQGG